jgi:hypothetical protein
MRLEIGFDDDLRYIRREPRREISQEPPKKEPLIEPGPLERRVRELSQRAEQNRFPEILRRQYERHQAPDPAISREPAERHVRSRHHLPHSIPGVRLHREEKQLLHEAGRFRVLTVKDIAQTVYSGDERAAAVTCDF